MKAFYFQEVFKQIENIEGDVVECGVGYGNSIVILGSLVATSGKDRRIFGFDSFEGFPDTSEDWSRAAHFKGANIKRVRKRIESAQVPVKIELVKGFFEDALSSYEGRIAFLHIDVDIASSYTTVLEMLFDKVEKGGVVLFDEYKNPQWKEATDAIDVFLGSKYEIKRCLVNEKYYVIK